MRVLWVVLHLFVVGLFASPEARADEPLPKDVEAPSAVDATIDAVDQAFGDYVVHYLNLVMFFDLVFWDPETLPHDASEVGREVHVPVARDVFDDVLKARDKAVDDAAGAPTAEQLAAREAARGLVAAETFRVTEANPDDFAVRPLHELVTPPVAEAEVTYGPVSGRLHAVTRGTGDEAVTETRLTIDEQPVDLGALGVVPLDEGGAEGEDPVVLVPGVAPFPLRVDRARSTVLAASLPLPTSQIRYAEGMSVLSAEGFPVEVTGVRDNGVLDGLGAPVTVPSLPHPDNVVVPLVVAWLVFGAVFFTLRMFFVNIRMFPHAVLVTAGTYDNPDDEGEISHFQALSSALSATVGLGNIAGVAIAVSAGGPGAVFWMVLAGFLGMSSKFTECTLGQMYRRTRPDGSVSGGPMHYLDDGLAEMGLPGLGKVLAVLFALLCIGGSFGGGNMFQANQSFEAIAFVATDYGLVSEASVGTLGLVYGGVLTLLVGLVIIGGIQRIGAAAGIIVPFMCLVYVLAGLFILVVHASDVPSAFLTIVREAFAPQAVVVGGFMGVLVQGFRRAAFSNEAGVGSASIAHSAATTAYPVREGIVALLEPFVDTIIVCTMTGLVVVITGAYQFDTGGDGVVMTQEAFGSVMPWFPLVLSVAVILFAFSTMISWSYYGERCSVWLFGDGAKLPYRIVFLVFVFLGANLELGNVLEFSDLMILGMAFPNVLGAILLSGKVKEALDDYMGKLRAGEFG
ncbi:MAG: alanine/glycine:cation symporter family protein [Myxococcota bacterium]